MGSLFKTKRSIRTIFFDIGGVVVDAPMKGYRKLGTQFFDCDENTLMQATAASIGPLETGQITTEEFWQQVSAAVAESGGKSLPAWKFKGFWEGLLNDSLSVDQEVIDLVRRLKGHVRVAVLSNVIKEHAVILQKEGVYEHFNPVLLSCNTGLRKPDPAAYRKAAELTKTTPSRCLLVDDSPENLAGAQKVGFRVLQYSGLDDLKREMYNLGFIDHHA